MYNASIMYWAPARTFGQQVLTSVKKTSLFSDQSAGSRMDRLKTNAAAKYEQSQPKNGLVIKKDDNRTRLSALTKTRAGGYVVHPHSTNIRLF